MANQLAEEIEFGSVTYDLGVPKATIYTYEEFLALTPKHLAYYYVAKDAAQQAKAHVWRVYLKNKPIFEFDDQDNLAAVFPTVFPFVFVKNN